MSQSYWTDSGRESVYICGNHIVTDENQYKVIFVLDNVCKTDLMSQYVGYYQFHSEDFERIRRNMRSNICIIILFMCTIHLSLIAW